MDQEREDIALDALIASFFIVHDEEEIKPIDDPSILTEEDRRAIDALGDDLIDRLIEEYNAQNGN